MTILTPRRKAEVVKFEHQRAYFKQGGNLYAWLLLLAVLSVPAIGSLYVWLFPPNSLKEVLEVFLAVATATMATTSIGVVLVADNIFSQMGEVRKCSIYSGEAK